MTQDVIQPSPKAIARITITLFEGGMMGLDHPNDEVLARGLLDMGRSAMENHFRALKAPKVVPATMIHGRPHDARMARDHAP